MFANGVASQGGTEIPATIAQSVEYLIRNETVAGSSPACGSNFLIEGAAPPEITILVYAPQGFWFHALRGIIVFLPIF